MATQIDKTFASLIILTFFIISSLSWLVLRTLKEGRKALKEINNNSKWIPKKLGNKVVFD